MLKLKKTTLLHLQWTCTWLSPLSRLWLSGSSYFYALPVLDMNVVGSSQHWTWGHVEGIAPSQHLSCAGRSSKHPKRWKVCRYDMVVSRISYIVFYIFNTHKGMKKFLVRTYSKVRTRTCCYINWESTSEASKLRHVAIVQCLEQHRPVSNRFGSAEDTCRTDFPSEKIGQNFAFSFLQPRLLLDYETPAQTTSLWRIATNTCHVTLGRLKTCQSKYLPDFMNWTYLTFRMRVICFTFIRSNL